MSKIVLTYKLDPELLVEGMVAANRHLIEKTRPNRMTRILIMGVVIGGVPFLAIRFGLQVNPDDGHLIAVLLGLTLSSIFFLWVSSRMQKTALSMLIENDHIRGEINAEISEDGVEFVSGLGRSFQKWAAFQKIAKLRRGTALFAAGTVVTIPDEALPTDMSPDEFRDQISKWQVG